MSLWCMHTCVCGVCTHVSVVYAYVSMVYAYVSLWCIYTCLWVDTYVYVVTCSWRLERDYRCPAVSLFALWETRSLSEPGTRLADEKSLWLSCLYPTRHWGLQAYTVPFLALLRVLGSGIRLSRLCNQHLPSEPSLQLHPQNYFPFYHFHFLSHQRLEDFKKIKHGPGPLIVIHLTRAYEISALC